MTSKNNLLMHRRSLSSESIDDTNRMIVLVILCCILFSLFALSAIAGIISIPANSNIVMFDAGWYQSIANEGYKFEVGKQCNIAFFPLFPLTWKILQFSPMLISMLNAIIFIVSLGLLGKYLEIRNSDLIRYFFLPSVVFCFLPFSESFFFLAAAILLIGLHKRHTGLIIGGLLMCGLTRSISLFLIPVLVFVHFPSMMAPPHVKKVFVRTILFISILLISIVLVAFIQYVYTGRWFDFLEVQRYWNKRFQFPVLPLTTWGFPRVGWVDATAIVTSLIAVIIAAVVLYDSIFNKARVVRDQPFLFSVAYVALAGLVAVFYGNTNENTSVMSVNRYVFATPFAGLMLYKITDLDWKVFKQQKFFFLFWISGLLLFGITQPYGEIFRGLVYFSGYLYFFYQALVMKKLPALFVFLAHAVLFLFLFRNYLQGFWIG